MEESSAARPPASEPPGRPRVLVRQVLLALLSFAVALAGAEALFRIFSIGPVVAVVYAGSSFVPSDDPVLGYELRPGSEDGATTINQAGFRDRDFPLEKPDGVFRIAAVGDSITFGFDVNQDEAYPRQLEGLLNQAARPGAPHYEVLNFGVSGYNIPQIVRRVRAMALRYEPDLVLYGYSLNDPQEFSFEAALLERARDAGQDALDTPGGGSLLRLLSHSRIYRLVRALQQHRETDAEGAATPQDPGVMAGATGRRDHYFRGLHRSPESLRRLEAGLASLEGVVRETGTPVLVAIFPLFIENSAYTLGDVHRSLEEMARNHGLEVLDLQPVFEAAGGGEALHLDLMHPTARGHRVAAQALLRELAAQQPKVLEAPANSAAVDDRGP